MSRRTEKRRYGKYNKYDVVYADFFFAGEKESELSQE